MLNYRNYLKTIRIYGESFKKYLQKIVSVLICQTDFYPVNSSIQLENFLALK